MDADIPEVTTRLLAHGSTTDKSGAKNLLVNVKAVFWSHVHMFSFICIKFAYNVGAQAVSSGK